MVGEGLAPPEKTSNKKLEHQGAPLPMLAANANLILRRFAGRASNDATSAPANAKRTPIGVLFALCLVTNLDDVTAETLWIGSPLCFGHLRLSFHIRQSQIIGAFRK